MHLPWYYHPNPRSIAVILDAKDNVVLLDDHAERIVACVNACATIGDPSALPAFLKAALALTRRLEASEWPAYPSAELLSNFQSTLTNLQIKDPI